MASGVALRSAQFNKQHTTEAAVPGSGRTADATAGAGAGGGGGGGRRAASAGVRAAGPARIVVTSQAGH